MCVWGGGRGGGDWNRKNERGMKQREGERDTSRRGDEKIRACQ